MKLTGSKGMARHSRAWVAAAAAVTVATAGGPADAESATPAKPGATTGQGWFLGAGLGSMSYVERQYSSGALTYIYLQAGWRFNAHLALDGRAGTDMPGDCGCGYYYIDPYSPRVQSLYGLYLRGTIPLSTHWDVYALAGYASLKLDAAPGLAAYRSAANSSSFGVGLSWNFLDRGAVDFELLPRTVQGEGWRTDALNIGFRWKY
jgi:hypothetical protein